MHYNELIKKIESRDIANSYLFMGREEYLMDEAIGKIIEKYVEPSFEAINLNRVDGKDLDLEELIGVCETLPFMSEKKIVVLENIGDYIKNLDKDQDKFLDYLDDLADFLCLILVDRDERIKKNMKVYRHLNKKDQAIDFSKLQGIHLNRWVEDMVAEHDKEMSRANISYFIQKSSYTSRNLDIGLFELENELNKIIDYSKARNISKHDIDTVLIDSIDTNIFNLLDAITRLDTKTALNEFNNIYLSDEPIQKTFYMITRQIRMIFSYKVYQNKGYSPNMIQKKIGIGNFEFKKVGMQASNFSINRLTRIMNELLEMDVKLKTSGGQDKLLMEMFIVKLCKVE